jgi:hypothetical protein
MRAAFPILIILFYLITLILIYEEYKLCSSLFSNFVQPLFPSSLSLSLSQHPVLRHSLWLPKCPTSGSSLLK